MQTLTNNLANSFIQYPAVWALVWRVLGLAAGLLTAIGILFLAFGSKSSSHRYHYPKGSVARRCWQVGWLLLGISMFFLIRDLGSVNRTPATLLLVSVGASYILIFTGLSLGDRYYKRFGKALQQEDQECMTQQCPITEGTWPPPPNIKQDEARG